MTVWTKSISLPKSKETSQDADGFESEELEYIKGIPANIKDTTRSDEVLASQSGYSADIVVEIMEGCYNGASFFIDESTGITYDIQRSYGADKANTIQLTGQRREHGKL